MLPAADLRSLRAEAAEFFPAPGTREAEAVRDFGSGQSFVFPSSSILANAITLHTDLLRAVGDLLGVETTDLRLTQSDLWPKYGREPSGAARDNSDQRIHCDYPNHTLTHPPRWDEPEAVEMIIYLDDVDDCGGATAVVSRTGPDDPAYVWPIINTPGVDGLDYVNDRTAAEEYLRENAPEKAEFREEHLYRRETLARYRFGTILFYRHDTWHRGTVGAPGTLRLVHNLTFRRADAEWVNTVHPGWAWSTYRPGHHLEKLIGTATVEQRTVMGFPRPGHAYWNDETLAAVTARYAPFGFDPDPYR